MSAATVVEPAQHGGWCRRITDGAESEGWSVVQRHHRACLDFPGGPGYNRLIVDYGTVGGEIILTVPPDEVVSGGLDERVVTLEILNDYLSPTVEHVRLTGRAEVAAGSTSAGEVGSFQWPRRRPGRRVVLVPVAISCGDD